MSGVRVATMGRVCAGFGAVLVATASTAAVSIQQAHAIDAALDAPSNA